MTPHQETLSGTVLPMVLLLTRPVAGVSVIGLTERPLVPGRAIVTKAVAVAVRPRPSAIV